MKRILSTIALLIAAFAVGFLYSEFKRPPYPPDWDRVAIGRNLEKCMKDLPGYGFTSIGCLDKGEPPTYWCKEGLGHRHWDLVIECDRDMNVTTIRRSYRDDRLGLTSTSMKISPPSKNTQAESGPRD
jgi:hypothetical protein